MYRKSKQFMTNPGTYGSRIYIGQLPFTILATDLEEKFKKHGTILGLALNRGFAFIQYETQAQAQAAIQAEHMSVLQNKTIVVKQALDKNQKGERKPWPGGGQTFPNMPNSTGTSSNIDIETKSTDGDPPQGTFQPPVGNNTNSYGQNVGPGQRFQERPSEVKNYEPPETQSRMRPHENIPSLLSNRTGPPQSPQGQPPPNRGSTQYQNQAPNQSNKPSGPVQNFPPGPSMGRDNRGTGPPPLIRGNNMCFGHEKQNFEPPPEKRPRSRPMWQRDGNEFGFSRQEPPRPYEDGNFKSEERPPPPFGPLQSSFRSLSNMSRDHPAPIDRNDCEIIVVAKQLTNYAEFIEQRLKNLGLMVDLLFPNDDVPIGRVLANISSRGCLYAILIMPQNEEQRSLTLNILHGITQEHRNIPLEDSLILISRNFETYMRGDQTVAENVDDKQISIQDRHPVSMQLLLNLLAENRQITSNQYDKLVTYLMEKRELQFQYEVGQGVEHEPPETNSKQTELQNRIMNILNKSASEAQIMHSGTASNDNESNCAGPSSNASPLLKDPSVQKALDSLLGGEMFKNISANA